MPNHDSGDKPTANPKNEPLSKSPVTPDTPQQEEMRKQSPNCANQEESATVKLERDIRTGESWLIAINALLLIANIVIASIYYGQLSQMKKATEATKIAADAAKNSSDLQRTVTEGTQAAEVMPSVLDLNDGNFLRVSVMNVGGVTSPKSSVDVEVSRQHLPDKRPIGVTQAFHFTAENLGMKQPSNVHIFEIMGYTQKDKWNIYHKRQAIIVNLTIGFDNGFGKWVGPTEILQ
jgi:hypothetical protein